MKFVTDDIISLLPKGFEVIGALIADDRNDMKIEKIVGNAISAVRKLRKSLYSIDNDCQVLIGAVLDLKNGVGERDVQFFMSRAGKSDSVEEVGTILYEDEPEKFVWDRGCIVRCELPLRLPLYYHPNTKGELFHTAFIYLLIFLFD